MIELVDEKRREELWQAYMERCPELRKLREEGNIPRLAGARTDYTEGILDALEELGVRDVIDVPCDPRARRCHDCEAWDVHEKCCALSDLCPTEGAIIIRAKA